MKMMKTLLAAVGLIFTLSAFSVTAQAEGTWKEITEEPAMCPGYASPEEGLEAYITALNAGDNSAMLTTFFYVIDDSFPNRDQSGAINAILEGNKTELPSWAGRIELIEIMDLDELEEGADFDFYQEIRNRKKENYGFEDIVNLVARIRVDDMEYLQFMQCAKKNGVWFNYQFVESGYSHYSKTLSRLLDPENPLSAAFGIGISDEQKSSQMTTAFQALNILPAAVQGIPHSLDDLVAISSPDMTTSFIYQDGEQIGEEQILGGVKRGSIAKEKNSAVLLTAKDSLYYITDHSVEWISDSVNSFQLALEGNAVAYCTTNGMLCYFTPDKGSEIVAEGFNDKLHNDDASEGTNYKISPDGSVVVFSDGGKIFLYYNGEIIPASGTALTYSKIFSVSAGAEVIYLQGRDESGEYGFFAVKKGVVEKLPYPVDEDTLQSEVMMDWTDDGTAIMECVSLSSGSYVYGVFYSKEGGPLELLSIDKGINIAHRLEYQSYRGYVNSPLNDFAGSYCSTARYDNGWKYDLGYVNSNMELVTFEGQKSDLNNRDDYYSLNNGSVYFMDGDRIIYYKADPESESVQVTDGSGEWPDLYYNPSCETVYILKSDFLPVKDGTAGEPFNGTRFDQGITGRAFYYFEEDAEDDSICHLQRRTLDGVITTLLEGVSEEYAETLPIEDFAE